MSLDAAQSNSTEEPTAAAEQVETIEPMEVAFELHGAKLSGGLTKAMLDTIRHHLNGSWHNLLGHQQKAIKADLDRVSRELVRLTVSIIASRDFKTVDVSVGPFKVKGEEIKGEYTTDGSDANMLGIRHAGRAVLVLATPEAFYGEVEEKDADPTEPNMFEDIEAQTRASTGEGDPSSDGEGGNPDGFEQVGDAIPDHLKAEQRRYERANDELAATAEEKGRKACDDGKERSCPKRYVAAREAWLAGYDARGVELARIAIADGADAANVIARMKEVGVVVPDDFPTDRVESRPAEDLVSA